MGGVRDEGPMKDFEREKWGGMHLEEYQKRG